jgi:hypothetical protein
MKMLQEGKHYEQLVVVVGPFVRFNRLGYFDYGKKQSRVAALISGVALMAFPYFVTNAYLSLLIGIALPALPFFLKY